MKRALIVLLAACRPYESALCEPCIGACPLGLECVSGLCVSEAERCGIVEGPRCGEGPACGDGFECFEDQCRVPVEIATGHFHTCARWPSGRVSCWGSSLYGQSGSDQPYQLEPQVVDGIDDAISIVAGAEFSCALRANGKVACWGRNQEAQLGNFSDVVSTIPYESSATPREVYLDEPAKAIAAGAAHACAIGASGRLYCWGRGGRAEGDACLVGDDNPQGLILPRAIDTDLVFDSLSGGFFHTIGIAGGRAWGIGSDAYGQITGRSGAAHCSPRALPYSDVVVASAGGEHTCIADSAGVVRCIGKDNDGEPMTFGAPVVELKAGHDFTCARLFSGEIVCWGRTSSGVLGTLDPDQPEIGPPLAIRETSGAINLDTGSTHACVVRDGDGVYCWGSNVHGQLGIGTHAIRTAELVLTGDFVEVAPGADSTCARERNGRVWCWGRNVDGAVGSGRASYFEAPIELPDVEATAIVTGEHFGCELDVTGEVKCWGRFDRPVNGIPGSIELARPTKIEGASGAESIAAGSEHACGKYGDELRCWGVIDGFLRLEAVTLAGISDIAVYTAGSGLACTVQDDGALRCARTAPFLANVQLTDAVELETGGRFACVRASSGTVSCWGENIHGQLGNGTDRSPGALGVVRGLDDVVDIGLFFNHTCALRRGGDVWCWGQDFRIGRLGLGPTHDRYLPERVPNLPPARALGVGRDGGCIVAETGDVWCWGFDDRAQVTGRAPYAVVPVRVMNLR